MDRLNFVRWVLHQEANTLRILAEQAGTPFENALTRLESAERIVVTGVGKSGHVGRRMAATFTSTGTPAVFMHAVEAAHGDLGIIDDKTILIALSHSGRTTEVLDLMHYVRVTINIPMIAIVGDGRSPIATAADTVVTTWVGYEADDANVVPSCSCINTAAVGDALALTLQAMKGYGAEDFKRVHPGGALGERLHGE